MKRSKLGLDGGRPRRPGRRRTIGLESLERRELLATLDVTFGGGGRTLASITTPGATNATYGAITTQPDGKYIVVGTATNVAGNRDFAIARLNADGTPDTTFNRGAGVKLVGFDLGGGATGANDDIATGVDVQPDGKIVVAGTAGGSYVALTRLHGVDNPAAGIVAGDFDLTFEDDGKVNENALQFALPDVAVMNTVSVAVQEFGGFAGRIVVAAGNFVIQFNGTNGSQATINRVTFTGNTFDPGDPFGPGLSSDTIINDMVIDPLTGKIIVVGYGLIDAAEGDTFEPDIDPFSGMGIARLNPNGSNDFTFGSEVNYFPYIPDPTPPDPVTGIDSDLTDVPFLTPRFTFSLINTSDVTTSVANGVALGPDGSIYVVGTESQGNRTAGSEGRMLLVKLTNGSTFRGDNRYGNHTRPDLEGFLNVDGVRDTSFTAFGVFPIEGIAKGLDVAYDAVDDRVVAIGYVNLFAPTRQEFAVIRTDRNGVIDTNFASSFGTTQDSRFQTVGVSQLPGADLAQDVVLLPDGRVVVAGTSGTGTTSSIGLVRLLTDEPPTFSIDDVTVTETDSGTVDAVFRVTLSSPYRVAISVDVSTTGGTAVSGTDFSALPTTRLTFAPGVTFRTVTVPVTADFLDEPDETFTVNLANPVLGTILDGQGVGTIVDNDPPHPTISISDATVTEGHDGTSFAVFTVTLSRAFQLTISVDVSTANGSATAGTDYTALPTPTTVTFAPGETSKTVAVPVSGDPFEEGDETFTANLSNPVLGLLGPDVQGVGTIVNDDPTPPTISIGDVTVVEGHAGTSFAVFTVSLSAAYIHGINVNVSTADGTALAGSDFVGLPLTNLTFAPGQISRTVSIPIGGDPFQEADETFTVNLSSPFLATILDGQAVGTIVNDDPTPPTFSIGDVTVTEGDAGTSFANFTVSLSAPYIHYITVDISTGGGTAFPGLDYTGLPLTTLGFLPGVTSAIISIPVASDLTDEPDETFFVNLVNPFLATILDGQAVGIIVDNDPPPDVTPPIVTSVTAVRSAGRTRRRITSFQVQYSEAMDPSRAQNFDNYILNELRQGQGRLGRPRRLALSQASYDPATNIVTLVAAGRARFQRGALLTVGTGVTDRAGNPLDGNSDGVPGPGGLYLI